MLTRLGEAGTDAFTMRIAGHSSVTVSQRYVHASQESIENAFEKLDALNRSKRGATAAVPTISTTVEKKQRAKIAAKSLASHAMGA